MLIHFEEENFSRQLYGVEERRAQNTTSWLCNIIAYPPSSWGQEASKVVFLADLPFFHCAGPIRICVEGQRLTKAFTVADATDSSKVTPDGS